METKIAEFKVRTVGLAARCEVCHQDDLFNRETGECARCSGLIPQIENVIPSLFSEPISRTPVSDFGRRTALTAAILASIMAVPGTLGVMLAIYALILFIVGLTEGETPGLKEAGFVSLVLHLSVMGFVLNYWYWKIARKSTETGARKAIWAISLIYNVLILGLGLFTYIDYFFSRAPLFFFWLAGISLMIAASLGALFEERKRG
jgi:hypothetical protein